jgi:hypothetical protein
MTFALDGPIFFLNHSSTENCFFKGFTLSRTLTHVEMYSDIPGNTQLFLNYGDDYFKNKKIQEISNFK